MGNLLYLVHRIPYPPNKGDKVRSYHLLKHLMLKHRVFLGTFLDASEDEIHVDTLKQLCPDHHIERLHPVTRKIRSFSGFISDEPLTLRYYQSDRFQAWVNQTLHQKNIDTIVVFSSSMAQYVPISDSTFKVPPMLVDFVDVDSEKWLQYSSTHYWPLSWLYRRESCLLRAYEISIANRSRKSFFVTEGETALFKRLAPECATKLLPLSNGVDTHFYAPDATRESPYLKDLPNKYSPVIAFTGAMDYWPNIDAVVWFCQEIWSKLSQLWPELRFYIVGRNPSSSVWALASERIVVTGTVDDVRPYLQHATLVVAPLRVARGVQNKILEAMAMARPVVATLACAKAINANACELVATSGVAGFVSSINTLL